MLEVTKELVGAVATGTVVGCLIGYTLTKRLSTTSSSQFKSSWDGSRDNIVQKSFNSANPMDGYVVENSLNVPKVLEELEKYTLSNVAKSGMLTDPVEGQLFRVLLRMLNAKKCVEVGTYTGYNALNMALSIPTDGKVFALDIEETNVNHGKPFFQRAGVSEKIDIRIGPATDGLDQLIKEGHAGTIDFVFIDADKNNYDVYYEKALVLLRTGGMIAIDNAFQGGRVLDPSQYTGDRRTNAESLHKLNKKVMNDTAVIASLLKIADGVNLCLKL